MKDYVKLYQKWILDPLTFIVKEIIEPYNKEMGKNLIITTQQKQAVEEVRKLVTAKLKLSKGETLSEEERSYSKKIGISIMAGKGLGKDGLLAWLIIWFMMCFPKCKIPCVSVSADQLSKVLWAEISKWLQHSIAKDFLTLQNDKLFFNQLPPNTKGKEWFAFPKTANPKNSVEEQVETLSGIHEDYVMIGIDESCHDDKTEILTDEGWKLFSELNLTEKVLTMDIETKIASYVRPKSHQSICYEGELYTYKARGTDFAVTPKHKLFYNTRRNPQFNFREISGFGKNSRIRLPKTFIWVGKREEKYTIAEKAIDMNTWLQFLGWYLSEGSLRKNIEGSYKRGYQAGFEDGRQKRGYNDEENNFSGITISQRNEKNRTEIRKLLEKIGYNFQEVYGGFTITNKALANDLKQYGTCFENKKVPQYIKNLPPEQIDIFLMAFLKGDGTSYEGGKMIFYTSSDYLVNDLQELLYKAGYIATITKRELKDQRKWINDHWATSSKDGYTIYANKVDTYKTISTKKFIKIPYKGMVYCVNAPPHNLLFTRRNGKCLWSGNSGIHDAVFSPLEGTLTQPCNFAFMVFNPTRSKGYAIDTQYKFSDYWIPIRWSAEDSELGNKDVIERTREQYGIESNPYRIRILGLPPLVDEQTLIPYDWIMDAVNREIEPLPEDPIIKSLDCGAGGDMSVLITRKGGKVFDIKRLSTQESQVLVNWAATDFEKDNADILRVDSIGIGWAVYGALSDRLGSRVESADSRKQASNPEKYFNKRAEFHWRMREKFEKGLISIPNDPNLIDQLSVITVSYEGGKIKIAEKPVIRKKLGHSPDESDALGLNYYYDDDIIYRAREGRHIYCHQTIHSQQNTRESWLGS